jgi:hypothetical protein
VYYFIVAFGFLLAMRGTRPAPLQRPAEGLKRVWREAADFFFSVSLILAMGAFVTAFERIQAGAREYTVLGFGIAAYLLSRYQKKTDVFFLSLTSGVFMIALRQHDLLQGIWLAAALSAGIGIFQTCFVGLRYKLLFSHVPASVKGWPSLCLLAGFISMVLWRLGNFIF